MKPDEHLELARACYKLGQVDRAAEHLEIAIAQPGGDAVWSSLATLIPAVPGASHEKVLAVRREFARRLAAAQVSSARPSRTPAPASRRDRLRIGYLSSFFDRSNYMKPVWGLINHHDRGRFQIVLLSDCPPAKGMPGYSRHPADRTCQTAALTTPQLADQIRDNEIDILVDLNGYSAANRLPLFAQKCAPLTVAWFNMYATTGLPAVDYIVGDDEVIRPDEEPFYSERVLRLPGTYLAFEVTHPVPPVVPPPCEQDGRVRFGSLVSQYKITPGVLDAWAEILRRAEGSSLLLANAALGADGTRDFVLDEFARRGVAPPRLELCGGAPHREFLEHYSRIDVALDAFPYNGGTTTMEAIWQGVPVLTFAGDRWASRTSTSLLRRCHLGEFVARDAAGMVQMAVDLANAPGSPARLGSLRHDMRSRLANSAACDVAGLAKGMEELYLEMWTAHASRIRT